MSLRLRPKNWTSFQHYRNRRPPWLKLHRSLLDDRDFACLPLASKALAPLLWLLASEEESGEFEASVEELCFRLRIPEADIAAGLKPLIDKGFFVIASGVLATCLQTASAEREREGERETEVSGEAKASPSSPGATKVRPQVPCQYQAVVDAYHDALPMLPRVRLMDDRRKAAMRKLWGWILSSRKADGSRRATNGDEVLAWLRDYFSRAASNAWLTGQEPSRTHPGWKADFDFLLSDRGMKAVIERTEVAA